MEIQMIKYPTPLKKGDRIGLTAPSSGVTSNLYPRFDVVVKNLESQGFTVIEGECLKSNHKHVSAPPQARAEEFMRFWKDPSIKAIMPPWGGEVLIEILPLIHFDDIKNLEPTWFSGFSDLSTLMLPLTTLSRVATVHGSNLMDLSPKQTDPLTTSLITTLQYNFGDRFTQNSSTLYQGQWGDFEKDVEVPLLLTEKTEWKLLPTQFPTKSEVSFSGRIIGGCLDTISRLAGTKYGDLPKFYKDAGAKNSILYFENCEMPPCELVRTLWSVRFAGWLDNISGLLIGRSSGPDTESQEKLSYKEALGSVLGDLDIPVIFDADIGHKPPQLNIVNGSYCEVTFSDGSGSFSQELR